MTGVQTCALPIYISTYTKNLLGSKTLGLNELELQFVMLVNHDQNVLVFVLDWLKVCLYGKLESSVLQNLLCKSAWLDQSKIRLDQSKLVQIVFSAEFSNSAQAHLTCRVLCFALSIKGKTLAMFYYCCSCYLCCVCKSHMRSRGVCLHIYLGLSKIKIMWRAWWSIQLLH